MVRLIEYQSREIDSTVPPELIQVLVGFPGLGVIFLIRHYYSTDMIGVRVMIGNGHISKLECLIGIVFSKITEKGIGAIGPAIILFDSLFIIFYSLSDIVIVLFRVLIHKTAAVGIELSHLARHALDALFYHTLAYLFSFLGILVPVKVKKPIATPRVLPVSALAVVLFSLEKVLVQLIGSILVNLSEIRVSLVAAKFNGLVAVVHFQHIVLLNTKTPAIADCKSHIRQTAGRAIDTAAQVLDSQVLTPYDPVIFIVQQQVSLGASRI